MMVRPMKQNQYIFKLRWPMPNWRNGPPHQTKIIYFQYRLYFRLLVVYLENFMQQSLKLKFKK